MLMEVTLAQGQSMPVLQQRPKWQRATAESAETREQDTDGVLKGRSVTSEKNSANVFSTA